MANDLFDICIGKTQQNQDYYLNINNNFLVVDKNKQGQARLFRNIINALLKNSINNDAQIIFVDYKYAFNDEYKNYDKEFVLVANNNNETVDVLDTIKSIQNYRIVFLKEANVKNIEEYNKKEPNKIPYIFIFINEINDLVENGHADTLIALTKLSRITGTNIIVATSQIDKTKSLCGKIKANFLNRICFALDTKQQSKLVLDDYGAENLNHNEIIVNDKIIKLN